MKIRPLTRTEEKRVLESVLYQLDGQLPDTAGARFRRSLYVLGFTLLAAAVALVTIPDPDWLSSFIAAGSLLVGLALGIFVWRSTAAAEWPTVARCIDRSIVEARLRELDA